MGVSEKTKTEEDGEWEIEILAFVKGKQKADNIITEILASLLNSPYTYIDIKLTLDKGNKPELQLKATQRIERY